MPQGQPPSLRAGSLAESRPARTFIQFAVAGLVLLALLGGAITFMILRRHDALPARPPDDPRLQYTGPFQNVHPDVAYVGDAQCADCHADQAVPFHRHPMGRSLLPVARVAADLLVDPDHHNPFDALGSRFLVERHGDDVRHRRTVLGESGQAVGEVESQVDYVVGSGTHGASYLTNRDGYLFQSPISWFAQKERWDKSPGLEREALSGRPVQGACFFCHANRVRPREGYANCYESPLFTEGHAIGCERCHGPGALHIKNPGQRDPETGIDYTIVNPKHLKPELRSAVCEQCHLEAETRIVRHGRDLFDFRPGLPLHAFWSVFVRAPDSGDDYKAVNHVEQMYQSRCFQLSADDAHAGKRKMGCTSCHDPHQQVGPEEHLAHYRKACLVCHETHGCSVPEAERRLTSRQDSCIDCHMRPYPSSDIVHNASTDHRILRREGEVPKPEAARVGTGLPVVPFYLDQWKRDDKQMARDLALALIKQARKGTTGSARHAAEAVAMLESALLADPEDVEAWEGKAQALMLLHDPRKALAAVETALDKAPRRELALAAAAMLSQDLQQLEPAISYWRRAIEMNPWMPQYRQNLALLLEHKRAWDEVRPECQAWLRLDPASVDARRLWVACLLKEGKKAEARAEFAKIEQLNPPNLRELNAWFTEQMRRIE